MRHGNNFTASSPVKKELIEGTSIVSVVLGLDRINAIYDGLQEGLEQILVCVLVVSRASSFVVSAVVVHEERAGLWGV